MKDLTLEAKGWDLMRPREQIIEETGLTFEALYNGYHKQMLFLAERILHNRQDAEDAVQNALLKISRQLSDLPTGNEAVLRAYILTATKNAALDLLAKRRQTSELNEETAAVYSDDLFEQIAASQDYDRLLAAIRKLPSKYSEALMLRYVQELTVAQIAALLGTTQYAIRKRLTRGKALLLQNYKEEERKNG